jgi:hypothetical protein
MARSRAMCAMTPRELGAPGGVRSHVTGWGYWSLLRELVEPRTLLGTDRPRVVPLYWPSEPALDDADRRQGNSSALQFLTKVRAGTESSR